MAQTNQAQQQRKDLLQSKLEQRLQFSSSLQSNDGNDNDASSALTPVSTSTSMEHFYLMAELALAEGDAMTVKEWYEDAIEWYNTCLDHLSSLSEQQNSQENSTRQDESATTEKSSNPDHATTNTAQTMQFQALSHRSSARLHLEDYTRSKADAAFALDLVTSLLLSNIPKYEIALCWLYSGQACFHLQLYNQAEMAFKSGLDLVTQEQQENLKSANVARRIQTWLQTTANAKSKEDKSNETKETKTSAKKTPPESPRAGENLPVARSISTPSPLPKPLSPTPPPPQPPETTSHSTFTIPKYQYYQSDTVLTILLLAPRLSSSNLHVEYSPTFLSVQVLRPGQSTQVSSSYATVIHGVLYDEIIVDKCKVIYKEEKTLIKLKKKTPKYEWPELLSKSKPNHGAGRGVPSKPSSSQPSSNQKTKLNPSSAMTSDDKKKPKKVSPYASQKDWNQIEKSLDQEQQDQDPSSTTANQAGGGGGDDALNTLFQQIYANADDDTKRAMVKSFQTSGGTVLSTNWKEVKEKNYEEEREAPKGMQWKNWNGEVLKQKEDEDVL